jgi:hypothetical protein
LIAPIALLAIPIQHIARAAWATKNHWSHPVQSLASARVWQTRWRIFSLVVARREMPENRFLPFFFGGGIKPHIKAQVRQISVPQIAPENLIQHIIGIAAFVAIDVNDLAHILAR